MTPDDAARLERCLERGGVALFPADTVYGLATDPDSREGVERIYRLKGRPPQRPSAVMFFSLESALEALPELPPRTREAIERLLPGQVTPLVPNPRRRFPLACVDEPERLGLRVPDLSGPLEPLAAVRRPALQTSANLSGSPDARSLDAVDGGIRSAVDVVLDGGPLPGTPSTVVDLTAYEQGGTFRVVREGAVPAVEIEAALR